MVLNYGGEEQHYGDKQFHHVLAALPPEIVCKLQPTILQSGDYSRLKEAVVTLQEKSKTLPLLQADYPFI